MLPDAALRAIAANLSRLSLDPLTHMKVVAAIAGPLMAQQAPPAPAKPPSPRPAPAPLKPAHGARRGGPGAKPNVRPGEASARARAALDLAPALSASALARAANCAPATAKRVLAARKANGADREPPAKSLSAAASPDRRARAYFEAALKRGPVPCADVDAEVDAHRLLSTSVERIREEMGLVCVRVGTKRGAVACYATRGQAAELDALVPPPGARDYEHREPASR